MTRAEIARADGFTIVSVGNGWGYEFGRNGADRVLWFQDDDATQFRAEFDAFPDTTHTAHILHTLWEQYA